MHRRVLLAGLLALGACGNDKMHEHRDGPIGPAYWQPKPGETKNWDIQVNAPIDLAETRAMMIVDLWASVPAATTIDYAGGAPVSVPAGANATTIATLQARQTQVICRVGLGGAKTTDPDFSKFPAGALSPMTLDDDGATHFLDFAQRDTWEDIAFARVDLAKQIGCDGIEPYLSDHGQIDLGVAPTFESQQSWYAAVALAVHERELSVGMRNGLNIGLVDTQTGNYDWLLVERCGEDENCELVRPFLNARKAVFAIDYTTDFEGNDQQAAPLCAQQTIGNVQDGLVKDIALSSAFRMQCQ